ncbi:MAG: ribosomal RNA small subunit methyltransferase A, partial [Desulfobacteraceae bacterium]
MGTSAKRLLAASKIFPKHRLGQHFLADPRTAEKMVELSGVGSDDVAVEIGAGLGALTLPLAQAVKKVYAVEIDRDLVLLLRAELASQGIGNVEVIAGNALAVDFRTLLSAESRKIVVLGNLPYNISSQVLIGLIGVRDIVSHAVLMFQKELAQRITAPPGNKEYGRITVALRYCAESRPLMQVKASQFYPRPKVDSQILEIRFRPLEKRAEDETVFFSVVKAAFSSRRKTLKNALAGSKFFKDAEMARQALESIEIDPIRRAE